jgi:hypothetical protein
VAYKLKRIFCSSVPEKIYSTSTYTSTVRAPWRALLWRRASQDFISDRDGVVVMFGLVNQVVELGRHLCPSMF